MGVKTIVLTIVIVSQLAFIQVFVYLVMFSSPAFAYLFDRFSKNKKIILISSSILFLDEILYAFKLSNRKKIIAITGGIYAVLTFLMAISDFLFLMIIQGAVQIVAGIMMLNYTSLMMTISNNGKYKTFTFQCLKMAYALSCVIFIPVGTFFSAFIQIETLFITVGFLAMLSVIPLALMKVKSNN